MGDDRSAGMRTAVVAGAIGAIGVVLAAVIGLFQPVVAKLADRFLVGGPVSTGHVQP